MDHPQFTQVRSMADSHGDKRACSMIAISIAQDKGYSEVRDTSVRAGVWDPLKGRWNFEYKSDPWYAMLRACGIDVDSVEHPKQPNGSRYSFKTIGKAYPKGRYIIRSRSHAAAMVDGEIIDWSENTRHIVLEVFKIEEPEEEERKETTEVRGESYGTNPRLQVIDRIRQHKVQQKRKTQR